MQNLRIIMRSFVKSQFAHYLLIWVLHSRLLTKNINSIHEGSLRITYQDHISAFSELLNNDNSVSIHQRNLQNLATEMFKMGFSPDILRETFLSAKRKFV